MQKKITINVPITITYYREEDKIPAKAFSLLIEAELLKPQLNQRLTDICNDAKIAALNTLNETFPPTQEGN